MRRLLVTLVFAGVAAAPARAHLESTGFGSYYDGVVHFARSPQDVLSVLAVAILAGLRGKPHSRAALFALGGAWLAGGLAGCAWPQGGELALACAAVPVLCGALAAAGVALSRAAVLGLAAGAGLVHGYANGATMGSDGLALIGAVTASFVLLALAMAPIAGGRARWRSVAARIAASWIAAIGLLGFAWLVRAG